VISVFYLVCVVSLISFAVFFVGCSTENRGTRRATVSGPCRGVGRIRRTRPVGHKLPQAEAADSASGRRFLVQLEKQMAEFIAEHHRSPTTLLIAIVLVAAPLAGQQQESGSSGSEVQQLREMVLQLSQRVSTLESELEQERSTEAPNSSSTGEAAHVLASASSSAVSAGAQQSAVPLSADDRSTLDYLKGTTINLEMDGYYAYNFNNPVGRVNLLRAYDVTSNSFNLDQAAVVFERAPDVSAGRRYGARLDLQFGQATETLQGNPANELRPDVYRHVFQAYGTYIFPLGSGLTVDFGKWASSLGIEGNYTRDQINYSRSYWFDFLPFYHMGFRTSYKLNHKLTLNYWLVNGTQQFEDFNGFKDQMFGFVLTPKKNITWTINYHFGQEHPDAVMVPSCGPVPVQPGLCFQQINPAPDGKLHIFDTYVSWQATPRLLLQLEGDYVIQRLWANAAPGRSSAPRHTSGGEVYAKYQLTPRTYIAGRGGYLSDRGGLFSGVAEALKEITATYDFKLADGFDMRYEYRRDWSNAPVFFTDQQAVFRKEQNTATLGVIWWLGRKQGAW
jgi:Putative beta-barrel porin-2, OmpL-like. bbp2